MSDNKEEQELAGGGSPIIKNTSSVKKRNMTIIMGTLAFFGSLMAFALFNGSADPVPLKTHINKPLGLAKTDTSNDKNVQRIIAEKNKEGAKRDNYAPVVAGKLPDEIADVAPPIKDIKVKPEVSQQQTEVVANNAKSDRSTKMLAMMQKLQQSWTHGELPEIIMFKDVKPKVKSDGQLGGADLPAVANKATQEINAATPIDAATPSGDSPVPYIRAGEVLYAYNKLEVNSDYGGPVILIGLDKRIKDAVFIASGYKAHGVALTIHPKTMSMADKTFNVDTYVLNPTTDATVVASEVDHHYFERWGSFLLVEGLNAYATVVNAMGQATTAAIGGATAVPTVTTTPKFSASQQGWIIAGKTLGKLSKAVAGNLNRPNTIYLHRHDTVAILFMKDIFYTPNKDKNKYSNIDVNALRH